MRVRKNDCISVLAAILLTLVSVVPTWAYSAPRIVKAKMMTDPTGVLSVEEMAGQAFAHQFAPVKFPLYIKPDLSAHWLRLHIEYPAEALSGDWVLRLQWNNLRSLALYAPSSSIPAPFVSTGPNIYISSAVPLPPPDGNELVCYVRMVGYGGINIDPVIVPPAVSNETEGAAKWVLGMFYGLLISMLVYNCFLFLSLRDKSYLWYVLHIFFVMIYFGLVDGLFPRSLIPTGEDAFTSLVRASIMVVPLMLACMAMFLKTFLMIDASRPLLNQWITGQLAVISTFVVLGLIVDPVKIIPWFSIMTFSMTLTVIVLSTVRIIQGFRPALIFFPGWLVYLFFGSVHSMVWLGKIPPSPVANHFAEIGSAVMIMAMSLALAYRVKILRKEKAAAEQEGERLLERNVLFSMLLDNSKLGICLVRDGHFVWANSRLQNMVGIEDLRGVEISAIQGGAELFYSETQAEDDTGLNQDKQVFVGGQAKDMRALGQSLDTVHEEAGTVWVVEDISEQRRLERLKEDVDQIIHHDLKSPLATISGLIGVVEHLGPLTEKQKHFVNSVASEASRGLEQIRLTLALYGIEAGTFTPEFHPVNVPEVLKDIVDKLRQKIGPRSELVISCGGFTPEEINVQGEELLIRTMLTNLVENGFEAQSREGTVAVSFDRGEAMCIRISNPGEVPSDIRETFFKKFATSGKVAGTGLGTYSAWLIARVHGGDIELDTSQPGSTTVEIRLQPA